MLRMSFLVVAGSLAWSASGGTVQEQISALGPATFQYTFQLTGFDLAQGQALDIEFDPAVYLSLSNPSGPAGFNIVALQPGNPPGTTGDFIVEEPSSGPASSPIGPFEVDATLSATGQPGTLPFFLYNVNSSGMFENLVQSGATILVAGALATPEPFGFWSVGLSLLASGLWRKVAAAAIVVKNAQASETLLGRLG
ncbi:MAG TPA: hypothetical protein VKG25_06820 [Bryobacteraceae bacterium]|nr:hypothetical protein [Bryobacteraceae bacterium]